MTGRLLTQFNLLPWPLLALLAVLFWGLFSWSALQSAARIWYISEIFNHCFFVLPGAIYLIYEKRRQVDWQQLAPAPVMLLPIVGLILLYAAGAVGDVQVFMHFASFSLLTFSLWFVFGHKLAWQLAYPLMFMLFAIPVGEELVPLLQEITADISVYLLKLTGIPTFRSGLYIEIPNGRFLVAEACSGISFFIVSIVIGTLYAHLNISRPVPKWGFIALSVLYPILANALRVYGIILTAYLTDMEHAVGADHLIYGWVFFLIVIISLLFLGELFRDRPPVQPKVLDAGLSEQAKQKLKVALLVISLFLLAGWLWQLSLQQQASSNKVPALKAFFVDSKHTYLRTPNQRWLPSFAHAAVELSGTLDQLPPKGLDYFVAWYRQGQGELISSLNRLYVQEDWTIVSRSKQKLAGSPVVMEVISSPNNERRLLAYWYQVGNRIFADKRKAKLYQIALLMLGQDASGGVFAFSTLLDKQQSQQAQQAFEKVIAEQVAVLPQAVTQSLTSE